MKKVKIIVSAGIFMIIAVIIYLSIPNDRNVFDEMYYGEERIFHVPYGYTVFSKIPNIKERIRKDDVYDDILFEKYTDSTEIDGLTWYSSFSFEFSEKIFSISFGSLLKTGKRIGILYEYSKSTRVLREDIHIIDIKNKYDEQYYYDTDTIKKYLDEADIPVESIKKASDKLLYDKVISDWTKYTYSKFSKENIGWVKIERNPLFDE
jgi:hypothetical protein